jgi:mono/diheme cytochrome c family protein
VREQLARILAALSLAAILAAALGFARLQNPPQSTGPTILDHEAVAAGRALYESQGCMICHAVGGEGEGGLPLDGVGARLNRQQMLLHIAPDESMRARFDETVFEMKQTYLDLDTKDLDALVEYMLSLR